MMKKDYELIYRLIKVFFFTILLLICTFSLITIVSAEETKTGIGYLNNSSVIISDNRGNDIQLSRLTTNSQDITIRNIIFQSNYNFQKDIVYEYEIELANQYIDDISSIYLRGGDTICSFISLQGLNNSYLKVRFTCPSNVSYITIGLSNLGGSAITDSYNIQWKNIYLWQINDAIDLGPIINGQNQNTQDIINNNDTNTQDIINNNDTNTNKIIEENKKNFETCGSNLLDGIDYINGTILQDGSFGDSTSRVLTDYFKIKKVQYNYNISDYLIFYIIEYDYQRTFIRRTQINNSSGTFTPGNNTEYLRISFRKSDNTNLTPQDVKNVSPTFYSDDDCTNKLDDQKNAINNLDGTLKDDNVDDNGVADAFESFNDYLDDNSTITQLITLPITLYTAILNNLNGACSPFNLGKLYGEDLILPCINISQYLGNSLWTMIDIIISGFAVYSISKKMIKVFNNFSSLREGDVIDD